MAIFSDAKLKKILAQEKKVKKHRILIVDDEVCNLDILDKVLRDDYEVIKANDGMEALELLQQNDDPSQIHLIISDQRMPKLTGVELLAKTMRTMPLTVRMILTAYTDVSVIIDAINKGHIYKYILKPFDINEMRVTVKRALEAHDLEKENIELISQLKSANTDLEHKVEERTIGLQSALEKQTELNQRIMEQNQEIKQANEKLSFYATTDSLTGIYNRRHFLESASVELSRALRNQSDSAVMMLDLDYFKQINDKYGHKAGDEALVQVCRTIKNNLRSHDIVGRLGGEEFAILLSEADSEVAIPLAERIRNSIAALEIKTDDKHFGLTISIGLTTVLEGELTIQSALQRADEALYVSKNNGRDQINVNDK